MGDWTGTSREELRRHFESAHPDQGLPARRELEVPYEAPESCALCHKPVRNWDEFYNCLCKHCEMKETNPPKGQTEPADASNIPLPSAIPREMSRNPTSRLIAKTDSDLACDELLNSYLDRSDFVSSFSLDIFRKSHPPGYDVKRAAGLLSDLPDALWSFAEKLRFRGSEPYKRFGVMVCNHSGYAFGTKACQIEY